ncbi:MAG: M14 family metallopeptidase [bacterium]|nr:M14 family metallopeptidase [bacterium]
MGSLFSKRAAVIVLASIVLIGGFLILRDKPETIPAPVQTLISGPMQKTLGSSVQGRSIDSYTYGQGATHLVFVGGVHGGYEWNSVLLSYKLMDYLSDNPDAIPAGLTVTVIPNANPDGVFKIVGKEGRFTSNDVIAGDQSAGRFNANQVDLNRNFDCKWKPESTWKGNVVSAGTAAFSEPETQAIRDFMLKNKPAAVVFYHSQANAVYASECTAGILPGTRELMNTYSAAAGYPPINTFDAYEITGDVEGWLASINIPAITVELKTHEAIEWDKNLAGIKALFAFFAK